MVKIEGSRVYIEGVRKITWATGEMCEFASALLSTMQHLGENVPYDYILGVSGAAFRFTFTASEYDFADYGVWKIASDPYEPARRALKALGYDYCICEKSAWQDDATKIMASIDRGVPVLAYPVVGPSDCCAITGYDEGGKVLLGWSTFQDIPDDHNIPHDATGYFRKPGWHDNLTSYILLGAKGAVPPLQEVFREALKWAVFLMQTSKMGVRTTGFEGMQAWARQMADEKNYPASDEQGKVFFYLALSIHMTMLRDHCQAETFLGRAGEAIPDWRSELALAAGAYREAAQIRRGVDDLINDDFSPKALAAVNDPAIRRRYADAILEICAKEQEAIARIERLFK